MPNGQPAQLANLRPWRPGAAPKAGRRSRDVDKTLRMARKGAPEALRYVLEVLNDPVETTRWRLKAAELVLGLAMPKDPDALERMLDQMSGDGVTEFRITFVDPLQQAPVVVDHEPPPEGEPEPFEPVFVDPVP